VVFFSFYQAYRDRVAAYHATERYQKALRKRLVWVEPLFGEAKQWHQLVRFRLRGLEKVNIEGVLKAAGQNIKRLLSYKERWNPKHPGGGALLLPCIFLFGLLLDALPYHCTLVCKRLFQHLLMAPWSHHRLTKIVGLLPRVPLFSWHAEIFSERMDLLIAATALSHNLTLLTRNISDFQHIPQLKLYQPS